MITEQMKTAILETFGKGNKLTYKNGNYYRVFKENGQKMTEYLGKNITVDFIKTHPARIKQEAEKANKFYNSLPPKRFEGTEDQTVWTN